MRRVEGRGALFPHPDPSIKCKQDVWKVTSAQVASSEHIDISVYNLIKPVSPVSIRKISSSITCFLPASPVRK